MNFSFFSKLFILGGIVWLVINAFRFYIDRDDSIQRHRDLIWLIPAVVVIIVGGLFACLT